PLLAGRWRPTLAGTALQPTAPAGAALQATVPAGTYRTCGLAVVDRPLCRGPWPQLVAPLHGALAIADRPLLSGQAMAGRPCRRPVRG
ncbi:hypothetical protein BHM03_00015190, partial [Ensete ventricosum]